MTAIINRHTTQGGPWLHIPDPKHPGQFIQSVTSGGQLDWCAAIGNGLNTAAWICQGMTQGYWKVEILYPANPNNGKRLRINYKRTFETVWKSFGSYVLDLTHGATGDAGVFVPQSLNITPTGQEFWIAANNPGLNNGSLQIQINDSGCIGGHVVADTIRFTPMATGKSAVRTLPWQQ